MTKATAGVRAKMVCTSVDRTGSDEPATYSVRLSPVASGSEENKSFYGHTPGGMVALEVVSEETAKHFEQGKEYYVDFSAAG